jgi:hypothetical protein
MSILNKTMAGVLALCMAAGAFAQVIDAGSNPSGSILIGGNGVNTSECPDGTVFTIEVPNLICAADAVRDPFDGQLKTGFRPEVINLDSLTIRQVLEATGTKIDCEGFTLLVQAIRVDKETPWWKCTAFVSGPGSGANTNFSTGWRYADSSMLDESLVYLAFGGRFLGNRALLFSPPLTTYTLSVSYVRRDESTGRIGAPVIVHFIVYVKVPSRADIVCNIEYFHTVAAGATQKPKISFDVAFALVQALQQPDNLVALIQFETVVALTSIDFAVLRDMRNAAGQYDARFATGYLIDSDEEPIGCLLIEMANAALWF